MFFLNQRGVAHDKASKAFALQDYVLVEGAHLALTNIRPNWQRMTNEAEQTVFPETCGGLFD